MSGGGPPPQEQVEATLGWVTDRFREFYRSRPPDLPPRFGRREFGFLWTGRKFFLRHTAFTSRHAFHDFLVREAPHHAYYSTAYYQRPDAPTMKEKEWLGADLIFDLDADHLPGGDAMTFEQQLVEVKRQAKKLLDDFLLGDFGFREEHLRIVFSGGRGYHFHVTDPRVLPLGSAERREIVDYLSPNDIVSQDLYASWVRERAWGKDDFGEVKKAKVVPPAGAPGWSGRVTRVVCDELDTLLRVPRPEAVKRLTEWDGVGRKTAEAILHELTPAHVQRIREYGRLDQIAPLAREAVVQGLIARAKVIAPGETDEPVTADVKRLIRLPGSLHGKTGLRVTPLTLDEFDDFDPLRDAVALGDEPARVVVSKPLEVRLKDQAWKVDPGPQDLPLHLAMFATLRRAALRPWPAA